MAKDFKVTLHDGTDRAATFRKVFGRLDVCVQSPEPIWVNVPGFEEAQRAYMLDLKELSAEERARMVADICERFGLAPDFVDKAIDEHGVPILMQDCTLTIENPQRWV